MTVESERKVYAMHKNNRMEPGCAIMTLESERRVYAMHKNRRSVQCITREEWTLANNDYS